jgi:hypothetical protein
MVQVDAIAHSEHVQVLRCDIKPRSIEISGVGPILHVKKKKSSNKR